MDETKTQSPTISFGTSGWTTDELRALKRLMKQQGTDRSKLLRHLVREADKQTPKAEKAAK